MNHQPENKGADIGLIGLAVMGQNLVLNMADHGFSVVVYNRTESKTEEFLRTVNPKQRISGARTIEEFVRALSRPRKLFLMVKAGSPVDDFISQCLPFLESGDVIIDGGNSLFTDTARRCSELNEKGILFVGAGISGGEEGARHGPSIMPGGNPLAWPLVQPILQKISAYVDAQPCCQWVGEGGSGHYVKMVHNGIEYGDMQLIAEVYSIMRQGLQLNHSEIADIFDAWNQRELASYLIEITGKILRVEENKTPLVEKILDTAGQKGTGKWTVNSALDLGVPLSLIGESVFARALSSRYEERQQAAAVLKGPALTPCSDPSALIKALEDALYVSKIISYTQGFMLLREAAKEYHWKLDFGSIALLWRGGCIIRSQFLGQIRAAYGENPMLESLLFAPFFQKIIASKQSGLRTVLSQAITWGLSVPCLSAALGFYDGYRAQRSSANLIQAQRDFFGAHTYERVDQPRGQFFHTEWQDGQ